MSLSTNTTDSTITLPYLSKLMHQQCSGYSNSQLTYTYLVKDKFMEVMTDGALTLGELTTLEIWVNYIFEEEKQTPLSMVLIRCNNLQHIC